MQRDPLVDRLDHATRAAFEALTARTPGGRIVRQDGLLLVIGTDPSPIIVNTILPEDPDLSAAAVDRAVELYRAVDHQPSLMTRDHDDADLEQDLVRGGWRRFLELPGMVLEHRLTPEPAPQGATLHRVASDTDRERWIEGNLHGFAEDDGERSALRSAFQTLDSLLGDRVTGCWIEADGRGVASAMGLVDPASGAGVVGWVGTDDRYRRRGLGRAVTLATVDALFDLGASLITLQASPMGLPVYERIGFRTIAGYKIWLPPASA